MTSALLTRALPLLVVLAALLSSTSILILAQTGYPATYAISVSGCPVYVDDYPTYPWQATGNCTAGTLMSISGVNLSSSIASTQVILRGQHLHNLAILSTNSTTIIVEVPVNPEPDLGFDQPNSFILTIRVDGQALYRFPPRNLGMWYDMNGTETKNNKRISSE